MPNVDEEVIYREPRESDLPELGSLIASVWPVSKKKELEVDAGIVDLAHMSSRETFSLVAELNGKPIGYIGARAGDADPETEKYWCELCEQALARLESQSEETARELVEYYEYEEHAHSVMLKEHTGSTSSELVLFAVSEAARGRGVGSRLLREATDYLKSQGAKSYFLYTDSSCNWEYYEHRGMKRTATYISSEEEIAHDCPESFYIYECNL